MEQTTTSVMDEKQMIIDLIQNKKQDLHEKKENKEKIVGYNCLNAGSLRESIECGEQHIKYTHQIEVLDELLKLINEITLKKVEV